MVHGFEPEMCSSEAGCEHVIRSSGQVAAESAEFVNSILLQSILLLGLPIPPTFSDFAKPLQSPHYIPPLTRKAGVGELRIFLKNVIFWVWTHYQVSN